MSIQEIIKNLQEDVAEEQEARNRCLSRQQEEVYIASIEAYQKCIGLLYEKLEELLRDDKFTVCADGTFFLSSEKHMDANPKGCFVHKGSSLGFYCYFYDLKDKSVTYLTHTNSLEEAIKAIVRAGGTDGRK